MDSHVFLKWLRINALIFAVSFVIGLILVTLFPEATLGFVREWGARSIFTSSALLGESTTAYALFVNVFTWNGLVTLLFFAASLILLAPLISIIMGLFYSMGFMSSLANSVYPAWYSALLIFIEVLFMLIATSAASAIGSSIFAVNPKRKDIADYWKANWNRLLPKTKRSSKDVFRENTTFLTTIAVIIMVLLLIGAWLEAFV